MIGKRYSRFDSDELVEDEVKYRLETWDEHYGDREFDDDDFNEDGELNEDKKREIACNDVYDDWQWIFDNSWECFCDDLDNLVNEIETALKPKHRYVHWYVWEEDDDIENLREEGPWYGIPDSKKELLSFGNKGLFRNMREGPERLEVYRYGKYGFIIEFWRYRYYFRPEHLFLRDHAKPRPQKPMQLPKDALSRLMGKLLEVA